MQNKPIIDQHMDTEVKVTPFDHSKLKDLSPEEALEIAKQYPRELASMVFNILLPELKSLVGLMNETNKCKQFQRALQDVDSLGHHMASFILQGPHEPYLEIDELESEMDPDMTELPAVTTEEVLGFNPDDVKV